MAEASRTTSAPQDEYYLESPVLRAFVAEVRRAMAGQAVSDEQGAARLDVEAALDALQPHFAALLADQAWLPDHFAAPYEASGMGGGIANWLLFRAADRSLALFSLVVPAGSQTPVHDHLAWGFVGLYRGEQAETVYRRMDGTAQDGAHEQAHDHEHNHEHHEAQGDAHEQHAHLTVGEVNYLQPGDFYRLIPPDGDIHAVKTTSPQASVSIHLLANDTGCVVRHSFDVERSVVRAFRSGYSNVACDVDEAEEAA
jgi:predicted metal-dependent enzyme (double-stranded beta helix superfamily)